MIGFTPQDVNAMTLWQFVAAVDGYVKANSPDDGTLSSGEIDDLWQWMQDKD